MVNLFTEAVNDLGRHLARVAQYVLATTMILAVYRVCSAALEGLDPPGNAYAAAPVARLLLSIGLGASLSAVQALVFAPLGAAIARPVWKYRDWRDALKRFFLPWLIINLLLITIMDIRTHLAAAGETDAASLLELVWLGAQMSALPVGTAVMFWGALRWRELPEAMTPLFRFFQITLIPLGLALLQYLLVGIRANLLQEEGVRQVILCVITDAPLVLMEVLMFTVCWRICLLNQTLPKDTEDPLEF